MKHSEKAVFYPLVFVGMLLVGVFGYAWFMPEHVPNNFHGTSHVFDVLLFAALSYVVWHQIATEILLWLIVEKLKKPVWRAPKKGMKVAFITTFVPSCEPVELLDSILPALKRANYSHDTWLLDEGNSEEAKSMCDKYGVKYFTRCGLSHYNTQTGKFTAKTKGGNHNAWYDAHGYEYDIVAQIDTDFIPKRNFLTRTLGYFNDPEVAFVGTPQIYGNTDRSFVARGAEQQGHTFYGPILQGLYGRDMSMLLGANHVIRVAALRNINYYGGHLTEDLLTGMRLHAKKWKSVYVPEPLAFGEGPETWEAYFNQQMRWAFGAMHILLTHAPELLRTMTFERQRYYLMLLQHYFSGLAMAMGVVILLLNFVFGIGAADMGLEVMFYSYIPLVIWQYAVSLWLQRFNIIPQEERGLLLAGKIISMAAWPIYFMAFIGVLRGKRLTFKVTPKGEGQTTHVPLAMFTPHLTIAVLVSAGFISSFITHHQNPIIIFWALTTMTTMFGISFGAWLTSQIKTRREKAQLTKLTQASTAEP